MNDDTADLDAHLARVTDLLDHDAAAAALPLAQKTCSLFPDSGNAARLHGVALLMLGRVQDARGVFEQAIQLGPGDYLSRCNYATALLLSHQTREAIAVLEQVVREQPGDAAIRNNFANALHENGEDVRAREEYLAALAIAPQHLGARINLAAAELALGMHDGAEARLRSVLAQQPHPHAWLLLGHVLARRRRFAEAQAAYLQGSALAPRAALFPYQAGLMADEQHQWTDAATLYQRALQLDPGLHLAEGQLLFVLRRVYDWAGAKPLGASIRARAGEVGGEVDPFAFLAEDASAAEQLACAQAAAARVVRGQAGHRTHTHFQHASHPGGAPLKVGFVSAGFGAPAGIPHATALLAVAMLDELGQLDEIDLHLIATTPDRDSPIRERLCGAAAAFLQLDALPPVAIAERINAAHIDVLVDVDGWCAGCVPEVFALRPAPVQAAWLAYAGTSGAPCIDYIIADRFVIPEPLRPFYSEQIAWLPRCYQPSDPGRSVPAPPPRRAFGLPEQATVFASFNNSWKLNAASFARMCAVVREVDGSVLWLLDAGHDANARLRAAARADGLDPCRLVFSPALPHLQHLARYQLADLFLDTNPYNAHTTASDAIWAGCPVLTRPGKTFASRVAGSLNHHLGLPELIAADDDAFIAAAVRYGRDRAALVALRERLAALRKTSGLFDMRAYARDFAALLVEMDARHRNGLPPAPIAPPQAAP